MLQNSEYNVGEYISWLWRTSDFSQVMYRKQLIATKKAKLLKILLWLMAGLTAIGSVVFVLNGLWLAGLLLIIITPWILAYLIVIPLWLGYVFVQMPREKQMIIDAKKIIANHKGKKIAIAGSYGKTTAKEALSAALSEGMKVAATPGNQNTLIGISRFVHTLNGEEDIIIFELGESHVGDIRELSELTQPDMGVITGINEAHLKTFKTLKHTVATIFELRDYLGNKPLYKNIESSLVQGEVGKDDILGFSRKGINGWKIKSAKTSFVGTEFILQNDQTSVKINTGLLGLHTIGIVSAAVAIAKDFSVSDVDIQKGLSNLSPVEHRLQPRHQYGAWLIDDTYNGNIEGVEVGLELLKELPAKRRIYVTPGLVEQGDKSRQIHENIGSLVAKVADEVVLMKNSTTEIMVESLKKSQYKGSVTVVEDPLNFYKNIDQVVAKGDVVLMQNDWTDNYH